MGYPEKANSQVKGRRRLFYIQKNVVSGKVLRCKRVYNNESLQQSNYLRSCSRIYIVARENAQDVCHNIVHFLCAK